jgi:DNA-binding NarL/FixJ family response regulator
VETVVFPLAVLCSLGLGGVALSIVAIAHAKSSARYLDRRSQTAQARLNAELETAKEKVSELEGEVCQMREQTPQTPPPPRSGFNLSTRSQALRMHRRGDSPGQIASTLQVSLQEVELLLKVHRIVLRNLVATARP